MAQLGTYLKTWRPGQVEDCLRLSAEFEQKNTFHVIYCQHAHFVERVF